MALFHAVRANLSGWKLAWAAYTLLIAVAYAGLDEWHQSFVPVREARFRDVLIDFTGALLAQVFVWGHAKPYHSSPAPATSLPEPSMPSSSERCF